MLKSIETRRLFRMTEFILLFFLVPFFYAFNHESSPIVFLAMLGGFGLFYRYKSPEFRNDVFINIKAFLKDLPRILAVFAIIATVLTGMTRLFFKEYLFYCAKGYYFQQGHNISIFRLPRF